jgi:hypothetical protein
MGDAMAQRPARGHDILHAHGCLTFDEKLEHVAAIESAFDARTCGKHRTDHEPPRTSLLMGRPGGERIGSARGFFHLTVE